MHERIAPYFHIKGLCGGDCSRGFHRWIPLQDRSLHCWKLCTTVSLRNVGSANYRLTQVLYADLGVAGTNGAVTFYANGKPIPGCRSIQSVTLSASCNWKPAQLGVITLAAKLVPSNATFTPSSSSTLSAMVIARNTTR